MHHLLTARVSVVIPAYNAETSIAASVKSAAAVGAYEVVVVDDGSRDNTAAVALDAGASLVLQTANRGAASARRTGAMRASSDYIIFCDADDVLLHAGVEESLRLLEMHPEASGACGASRAVRDGVQTGIIRPWSRTISPSELILKQRSFGPPACSVWHRSVVLQSFEAQPPPLEPPFAEDYELYIRLSCIGEVLTHQQISCIYSVGQGKSFSAPGLESHDTAHISEYYADHLRISVQALGRIGILTRTVARKSFYSTNRLEKLGLRLLAACLSPRRAARSLLVRLSRSRSL